MFQSICDLVHVALLQRGLVLAAALRRLRLQDPVHPSGRRGRLLGSGRDRRRCRRLGGLLQRGLPQVLQAEAAVVAADKAYAVDTEAEDASPMADSKVAKAVRGVEEKLETPAGPSTTMGQVLREACRAHRLDGRPSREHLPNYNNYYSHKIVRHWFGSLRTALDRNVFGRPARPVATGSVARSR